MRVLALLALAACNGSTVGDPTDDTDAIGPVDFDEDGSFSDVDCDDDDFEVYPGADEYCDGKDNDCDGIVDEDAVNADTYWVDGDKDGYGADGIGTLSCDEPPGTATRDGDCNDEDPAIHPEAIEVCDEADVDEDCDGSADDEDPSTDPASQADYYVDSDGDGFGDPGAPVRACDPAEGRVADNTDCDDRDPLANPDLGCGFDWDGDWNAEVSLEFDIPEFKATDRCTVALSFVVRRTAKDQLRTTAAGVCSLRSLSAKYEVFFAGGFDGEDSVNGYYTIDSQLLGAPGTFSNPPPEYAASGKGTMVLGTYKATVAHTMAAVPAK